MLLIFVVSRLVDLTVTVNCKERKKERKKESKKRKKERKMRSKKVYETTKGFFDGGAEAERFALGFTIRTE